MAELFRWVGEQSGREPIYEPAPGVEQCLSGIKQWHDDYRAKLAASGSMHHAVEPFAGGHDPFVEHCYGIGCDPADVVLAQNAALDRAIDGCIAFNAQKEVNLSLRQSIKAVQGLKDGVLGMLVDPPADTESKMSILRAKTAEYSTKLTTAEDLHPALARLLEFVSVMQEHDQIAREIDEHYAGLPGTVSEALVEMAMAEAELVALEEERARLLKRL